MLLRQMNLYGFSAQDVLNSTVRAFSAASGPQYHFSCVMTVFCNNKQLHKAFDTSMIAHLLLL